MVLLTHAISTREAPEHDMWNTLARLVFRMTVAALLIFPLIVRLQFLVHILANVITSAIGVAFSSHMYCQDMFGAHGYLSTVQTLGSSIDGWIAWTTSVGSSALSHTKVENGGSHSCWVVVAYVNTVFGILLPGALLYLIESYLRVKFAMANASDDIERNEYWQMLRKYIILVPWFTIIVAMLAWAGLKSLEDVMSVDSSWFGNVICA